MTCVTDKQNNKQQNTIHWNKTDVKNILGAIWRGAFSPHRLNEMPTEVATAQCNIICFVYNLWVLLWFAGYYTEIVTIRMNKAATVAAIQCWAWEEMFQILRKQIFSVKLIFMQNLEKINTRLYKCFQFFPHPNGIYFIWRVFFVINAL